MDKKEHAKLMAGKSKKQKMSWNPPTCKENSCKCFCHVTGRPEGDCCGRAPAQANK